MAEITKPSRDLIIELAHTDPVVYRCLKLWLEGSVTYEQALELCVLKQAEQNEALRNELAHSIRPLFVKNFIQLGKDSG